MNNQADAYWRKSTRSNNVGGSCVEVAACTSDTIAVRDSKIFDGPTLSADQSEWSGLLVDVKRGRFDCQP